MTLLRELRRRYAPGDGLADREVLRRLVATAVKLGRLHLEPDRVPAFTMRDRAAVAATAAMPWAVSGLCHLTLVAIALFILVVMERPPEDIVVVIAPPKPAAPPIVEPPPLPVDPVPAPLFTKEVPPDNVDARTVHEEKSVDEEIEARSVDDVGGGAPPAPRPSMKITKRPSVRRPADHAVNRIDLAIEGGGSIETEDAVLRALKFLSRTQAKDGAWKGDSYGDGGVSKTAFPLLAFLGAGYAPFGRAALYDGIAFRDVVKRATDRLLEQIGSDGCLGASGNMYAHSIGLMALCQAYSAAGTSAGAWKPSIQKAVDFLVKAQNENGGWRYTPRCGDSDTSVTGWAVMALWGAKGAGFEFDADDVYEGVRKFLKGVTLHKKGGTDTRVTAGYFSKQEGTPRMTAVMVLARLMIDREKSADVNGGIRTVSDAPPKADDLYYSYYGTLAMFQYDGPDGPSWRAWNKALIAATLPKQVKSEGNDDGSWPADGQFFTDSVYATALNALNLEVYYRYAGVFGAKKP